MLCMIILPIIVGFENVNNHFQPIYQNGKLFYEKKCLFNQMKMTFKVDEYCYTAYCETQGSL